MSKSNRKKEKAMLPDHGRSVVSEIAAIESGLGLTTSLTRSDRVQARQRSERVPDALIELLATIASQNEGLVAGMTFDAVEARATLAYASTARTNIQAARHLAQRMEDESIRKHTLLANRSFGMYRALARLVQTPEGEALRSLYEQMQSLVRPRGRRGSTKAASPNAVAPAKPTAPAAAHAVAVVAAPAAAGAVAPESTMSSAPVVTGASPSAH